MASKPPEEPMATETRDESELVTGCLTAGQYLAAAATQATFYFNTSLPADVRASLQDTLREWNARVAALQAWLREQ